MNEEFQSKAAPKRFEFQQSEALLQNVMENAAVGMALVAEGRIVFINRSYAEMLGRTRDECLGLTAAEVVYAEDLPAAVDGLAKLQRGELEAYRAERRIVRGDGKVFWGLVTASILRNERTGKPLYTILQTTDIGRQKEVEAALALTESRWNQALESGGQGVWDADLRGNTLFYSRTWRTMRGFAPDAEVDSSMETWLKRVHPDDRERIHEIVLKQNDGIIPRNAFDYRERHQDGHYVWILSRGAAVAWDDAGHPTRFVGTDTDISTLKFAEMALAVEKEKLRITLESIGDGVISTDAVGRITFMNPAAEALTGWSAVEAMGRRADDIFVVVDDGTGDVLPNPVTRILDQREADQVNEDTVLVSRTGERRGIRDTASPVRSPNGDLLGAVLVFQDITHARARQKELVHTAMHDGLTGLPNRAAFERALAVAVNQCRQEAREHALCFIDLDRFKVVNDSAGHAAGDALLGQIGSAIRRACRAQDFTARIGGDEFALLLADCTIAGAKKVAQQVIDAITGVRFSWHGRRYDVGASVGIAAITPTAPHLTELVNQADTACYAAKNSGRNGVVVYDPQLHGPEQLAGVA